MNILMITENDPAGTAIMFCDAVNRYTEHSCRLATTDTRYNFDFRTDLHVPDLDGEGLDELRDLLAGADLFHFHLLADEDLALGPFHPRDFMNGKAIVHHHHGHPDFRAYPEKYQKKYRERGRRNLLVSTPDLMHKLPGAVWMPNLVPMENELYTPLWDKPASPIVVSHSPTRKDLKNTDEFLLTMDKLRSLNLPVELDMIENTLHAECLRRKRRSHILFDHLQGYYGVSSLEGLSQGLPVVAGLDEWNRKNIVEFTGVDYLPWIITDVPGLPDTLKELILDPDMRTHAGRRSRAFMENHWNDRIVARRLADFYLET